MCVYVCCMSTFSNIFSSETTKPIEAKFHMEPPWDGKTKVCLGNMTKMAAMPIYGKNVKMSSSPEPKGRWPWNMVCSIGCSSTIKFIQMMTLGWPCSVLRQCQIWSLMLLYEKMKNNGFFRKYCRLWFETSNRWSKRQEVSVDIKTLSPGGSMSLPRGCMHVLNHEKKNV